jgi:hypothetical protein
MTTVNNATGVYSTLGYNFSDPNGDVKVLSANTLAHMNSVPALIHTWQAQDIANNSVNGYFQNPVANIIMSISSTANSIVLYTTNLTSINVASNTLIYNLSVTPLASEAPAFLDHTNRISGVSDYNTDMQNGLTTFNKPYYATAMAAGRSALYITNQTDNIQNTSPILGSFTSLLIGKQLSAQANLIITYPRLIANSITSTLNVTTGNTTNVSNLTYSQILAISNDISNTYTLLYSSRINDENFYINLENFNKNYSTVKQFDNMGETQNYLINNFIGTPKLISRINS